MMNISVISIAGLWKSEAGHYTLFIELAETYIDKERVRNRWKEWLRYEAGIMRQLTPRGDRMH